MSRKDKTLADFLAIGVSPVLIMALVGSLVFFLLEVLYQGKHSGRLQWNLFFFVFGAVLIARISMQAGLSQRAAGYGLILGFLVWVALERFIEYPADSPVAGWTWAINLGLIALIWWSAHRLTWDCTFIDDDVDSSSAGLMEVAGLDKPTTPQKAKKDEPKPKKKKGKDLPGLAGWWERYDRYREEKNKQPHAPGVWVVYFSLAALPLFGLGQAQIQLTETGRRAYSFWLMCIYVGSGLGLLLTTCFLGLRRYLRQRKLQMPASVTGAWLTLGIVLIVALMVLGAVLPRPAASNPILQWAGVGAKEQEPSSWGQVGTGDKGKSGGQGAKKEGDDSDSASKSGKGGQQSNSKSGGDKKGGGQQKGGGEKKGSGDGDKKGGGNDQGKAEGKDQKQSDSKGKDAENQKNGDKQNSDKQKVEDEDKKESGESSPSSGTLQSLLDFLAKLLKWIVIAIVVIVTIFFVLRGLIQFLANFTGWARKLLAAWNRWLTWWQQKRQRAVEETAIEEEPAPPRPFSSFADPFLTGAADRMSGAALVRYTFEALEAWSREQGFGRNHGETPLEFSQRVGDESPALETDARHMAQLYIGVAYGRAILTVGGRDALRNFWLMLAEVHVRPMSAAGSMEHSAVADD